MRTRVLVTGGAGFIGSHLVDLLLGQGYEVAILDSLVEQVHGPSGTWPEWTEAQAARGARLYLEDVRDAAAVRRALQDFRPHVVVHLAAAVGVGQAEVEIERYVDVNVRGTALLLEQVLRANDTVESSDDGIRRLVVAGSMSAYGEGAWLCPEHGWQRPERSAEDLAAGKWLPRCGGPALLGQDGPPCEAELAPAPVEEWASLRPGGIYAATKRDAEDLALLFARSRGLSTAVTRFFNVYGPRQAISNPYTGVCAIFAGRVLRGLAPRVYEDGGQVRDFVHVEDVARALGLLCGNPETTLALRKWADPRAQGSFNVGTGAATPILRVAEIACEVLSSWGEREERHSVTGEVMWGRYPLIRPEVTGAYRVGDVRACLAEPRGQRGASRLGALGWAPRISVEQGLPELFRSWAGEVPEGDPEAAHALVAAAGLVHLPAAEETPEVVEEGAANRWGG